MSENVEYLPMSVIKSPSGRLHSSYQAFMLSREAMRCTPKTLEHYRYGVGGFLDWLYEQGVKDVESITPTHIRGYLVGLQRRGLKDTTQHAQARAIKTFLRWLVDEGELNKNPMERVKMPRLEQRIPAPFSSEDVQKLLAACDRRTPRGARGCAIVLALLDSGLRLEEFVSLKVGDLDMRTGLVTVIGKGRKQRTTRVGARARAAIIRMLGFRGEVSPKAPLWVAYDGKGNERGALTKNGLQIVLQRLGDRAGVKPCSAHRFRRTFALWALRDGMDLHSLRLLMGHGDLSVLQRYLALAGEDVERAHREHSPVDRLLNRERG